MSDKTKAPQRVAVVSYVLTDGQIAWTVEVDGHDHGGGRAPSHAQAFAEASAYMKDRGWAGGAS